MLLLVFSLPYHLTVIALGGGKTAAGAATLVITAVGACIAGGTSFRRGALCALAAWAVGLAVLAALSVALPNAPILLYQQMPALTATCVVGMAMLLHSRRGLATWALERKVEPLAAKQVWACLPLVTTVAVVLSMCALPTSPHTVIASRPSQYPLASGMPLTAPPGWTTTGGITRSPVDRLYGPDAVLVRQRIVANTGNPQWDRLAQPRTVVVDSTVSQRPFSLGTYPTRVLYGLTAARISEVRRIDLGMGVVGHLISVIDDQLLVTWNSLQFVWGDEHLAQSVTIFAVDNHDPKAPFPQPTQNLFPTIRTLITLLFRGNAVIDQRTPTFKDADLLSSFGRGLVAAQFAGPAR